MQIRVSTGDCRLAIGAALAAIGAKLIEDRAKLRSECLANIKEGAEHNSVVMTPALLKEMGEMADRDADHMMQRHVGKQQIEVLQNYTAMLEYHDDTTIVIDDEDFHLLKAHLPKAKVYDETSDKKEFAEAVSR